MKSFDKKMLYLKDFLFDVMKPSIREFIFFNKPEEFQKWEGACCRQTSLITNWFLREWLLNNKSGYKDIQSWEGIFCDNYGPPYDHAWIYCVHEVASRNLLIDIGRTTKPMLFTFTPINEFPRNLPDYKNMSCVGKGRMNEKELWMKGEHFTRKTINQIIPKLTMYIKSQEVLKLVINNLVPQ